jgi:hypothetical protein
MARNLVKSDAWNDAVMADHRDYLPRGEAREAFDALVAGARLAL